MSRFRQTPEQALTAIIERTPLGMVTANFAWAEFFVSYSTHEALQRLALKPDLKGDGNKLVLAYMVNLLELAQGLERVRTQLGNRPIRITSGWRDAVHNASKEVRGAPRSLHLTGRAADIRVAGMTSRAVQAALESTWRGGMGYGATFTHLDTRSERARFNY